MNFKHLLWLALLALAFTGCGASEGITQLNITNATTLTALEITPATTTVPVGIATQFRAQGSFSDGSNQDLTSSVTWTSGDPAVATVNDLGGVSGVAPGGPVTITAAFEGISATGTVSVSNAVLESIAVTSVSTSLPVGATQQLTATGQFSDGTSLDLTPGVTWGSTDAAIVDVSASGLALGVSAGQASATAVLNAVTGTLLLTVTPLTEREFLITPDRVGNTVSVRQLDLATGQTTLVSTPAVGSGPTMVRVHPTRAHFYVTNFNSNTVSGLTINPDGTTGVLPGSPFAVTVTGARNVHVHPSGNFLYVAGQTSLESFSIGADGSLTSLGTTATTVAPRNEGGFTSDGAFLHIPVVSGVQSFSIDAMTGLATATTLTTIPGAAPVNDLAVSPDGSILLVNCQIAGANNDQIVPFTVAADGTLTAQAVNNLAFDVGLGDFASNGVYYVGDVVDGNNRLFGFTVSNVGALTGIAGSPFNAPGGGSQTALDKTGRFVVSAANSSATGCVNQRQADDSVQISAGSPFVNVASPFIFDFYRVLVP